MLVDVYTPIDGRFLAIEVKKSEAEMNAKTAHAKEQDAMIAKLYNEGAVAFKTYSWEHTVSRLKDFGYDLA